MRNLVIATAGFLVAAAIFTAVLFAAPRTTAVTVKQASPQTAMPIMSAGTGMMGSLTTAPAARKLTIRHVLRGCHVWANGKTTSATMRLTLRHGARLSIVNQDIDAHQLVQLSGPAKLRLGGAMMMNHGRTLTFQKTGLYRLKTRTVEMEGMGMEVETEGPDNILRLFVTVT